MEPTISVYFDNDRTYIALLEKDTKGISLAYVNSTTMPVDVSSDIEAEPEALQELNDTLLEIAGAANRVTVSLPMEAVFIHQFPASASLSEKELRQLVRFEISQHFPQQDPETFQSTVFPLSPRLDQTRMMEAVILDKGIIASVRKALQVLGTEIDHFEVAQQSAHNALAYNYPEMHDNTIVVFGIQGRYLDVSVIKAGENAYYNTVPLADESGFGEQCEELLQNILDEYVPYADQAFLFGSALTPAVLEQARTSLSIPVQRLNAFRLMTTTLGERERAYCIRLAHVLPPCVGGALPELQQGIVI